MIFITGNDHILYYRNPIAFSGNKKRSLLMDRLDDNKIHKNELDAYSPFVNIKAKADGNKIAFGELVSITYGSSYVGSSTGNTKKDFYVYEWYIRDTGEIFYIGKGRGDRYKEYHKNAYEAEKIRKLFDTECRFVGKSLTEDEALELETREMARILNETDDILTNRIIPMFAARESGYSKSRRMPKLCFETAPVYYATEIEEHYYNTRWQPFDTVEIAHLSSPVILCESYQLDIVETVYGGNYEIYYNKVIALLKKHGSRIMKTKYAKNVSAWIYSFDDSVINHELSEKAAVEKIGHLVPSYHLIDVWKALDELYR